MTYSKFLYLATLALMSRVCLAEPIAPGSPSDTPNVAAAPPASISTTATTPAGNPDPKPLTDRWLQLDTLSHSERYRNAFGVGGGHVFDNAQQRSLVIGKIKLDAQGRYDIGFRASSGRYFNWAYAGYTGRNFADSVDSPAVIATYLTPAEVALTGQAIFSDPTGFALATSQIHSNGWQFYMRELYFSATPVKPVTVEFGSFGFERGLSSEITSFDEDGYLAGERIRFRDPKHLFFDEVGFTNAYFGDIATPSFFDRGSSLKKSNYRQVFARKQLIPRLGFSGEYTWQAGTDTGTNTLREAAVVATGEAKVVDSLKFEAYERLNSTTFPGAAQSPMGPIPSLSVSGASGFAVAAQKKLGRLSGDAGYASVDRHYSVYSGYRFLEAVSFPLNGDSYGVGNRPFVHASFKIAPGVSAFGFYTHEVGSERILTLNQQGFNAGVTFDLKAMVNTEKRVF